MDTISRLKIKIYADLVDPGLIEEFARKPFIHGFTTNPTLMRAGEIKHYEEYARALLGKVSDKPISFEVIADDLKEISRQAFKIASWGKNVFVKVPITNSHGESTAPVIHLLASEGVKVNVTAILSLRQLKTALAELNHEVPSILSIFAGRIADTGRSPSTTFSQIRNSLSPESKVQLLWASPRELLNLFQAESAGADIITMGPDLLGKLPLIGRDLEEFSLDTVRMFKADADSAGYSL